MQIGIDILEMRRFDNALAKDGHIFVQNHYHPDECAGKSSVSLAGIFAAKEAIIKTGYIQRADFLAIQLLSDETGRPHVYDATGTIITGLDISISHTSETVVAVAIWHTHV